MAHATRTTANHDGGGRGLSSTGADAPAARRIDTATVRVIIGVMCNVAVAPGMSMCVATDCMQPMQHWWVKVWWVCDERYACSPPLCCIGCALSVVEAVKIIA